MNPLHHIQITVSDLATSRTFYDGLLKELGYQIHRQDKNSFAYTKEGTHLFFKRQETDRDLPLPSGCFALAFRVQTPKDMERIQEKLSQGLLEEKDLTYEELNTLVFHDPDGHTLKIVAGD